MIENMWNIFMQSVNYYDYWISISQPPNSFLDSLLFINMCCCNRSISDLVPEHYITPVPKCCIRNQKTENYVDNNVLLNINL